MKAKAVILASRPGADGEPRMENFKVQEQEVVEEPPEGHVVLKTIYLSVDPYMRCRMNEDPGTDYLSAWTVGGVAEGGGVGVVLSSRGEGLSPGDVVTSFSWPWQTHAVLPASGLQKVHTRPLSLHLSVVLNSMGSYGYAVLVRSPHVIAGSFTTVFIEGISFRCGCFSSGAQCLLIAFAILVTQVTPVSLSSHFWFNEINSGTDTGRTPLTPELVYCSLQVDVFVCCLLGSVYVWVCEVEMNVGGHVVLCGQISQYNKDVPYPPPLPLHTQTVLQERNISRDRFLVLNYPDKHAEGLQQLASWVQSGQLKVKETIMDGIENVGAAFVSMMQGGNIGKQLVLVSPL
uniref:15-oxoprostaglandin 13-reductase n=1 Tax=Petromyzon marinus TaxID=7757 RepID=S4RZF8_PETMA